MIIAKNMRNTLPRMRARFLVSVSLCACASAPVREDAPITWDEFPQQHVQTHDDTETLLDDVVIPMQIATQGFRVAFEPEAVAYDPQTLEPEREKIRKRRANGPSASGREEDLSMMQSRLSELWTQIRLVRAGGVSAAPSTRPKWD